jgi:hypothetical protein
VLSVRKFDEFAHRALRTRRAGDSKSDLQHVATSRDRGEETKRR